METDDIIPQMLDRIRNYFANYRDRREIEKAKDAMVEYVLETGGMWLSAK